MIRILENKKLHLFLWVLVLIFVIWGFYNPQEFMGKKWDYKSERGQYAILFIMLGVVVFRLIQIFLAIKKEKT